MKGGWTRILGRRGSESGSPVAQGRNSDGRSNGVVDLESGGGGGSGGGDGDPHGSPLAAGKSVHAVRGHADGGAQSGAPHVTS